MEYFRLEPSIAQNNELISIILEFFSIHRIDFKMFLQNQEGEHYHFIVEGICIRTTYGGKGVRVQETKLYSKADNKIIYNKLLQWFKPHFRNCKIESLLD